MAKGDQQPNDPPCYLCNTKRGRRWLARGQWVCENLSACARRRNSRG